MRLVADTNVVASALLWGDIPGQLLHAAREKRIELFTSTPLLGEIGSRDRFYTPVIGMIVHTAYALRCEFIRLSNLVRNAA